MLPPVGPLPFIGPWATLLVTFLIGGVIGAMVGPLFSGLFRTDGALRQEGYWLRPNDPVSGRTMRSAQSPRQAV